VKPEKDKLVVYELLVRDFDAGRNYQSIDRIDYFKNLKINAIELLPVMEFEGNESWGIILPFIWL
jgi:1,4-alpha-glucan branching enzyme